MEITNNLFCSLSPYKISISYIAWMSTSFNSYVINLRVIAIQLSTPPPPYVNSTTSKIKEWGVTDIQRQLVILLDVIYARLTTESFTTPKITFF